MPAMMPSDTFGLTIIFAYDTKSSCTTHHHHPRRAGNDAQWRLWSANNFFYDAKSYWLTFFHYGLLIITILGISSNDAQWRLWSVTNLLPMIWLTFLHCDSSSPSSAMMRSGAFGLPCVCYLQSFFCSAPKSRALECCCHLKPSSSVLSPSNIFIL